MTVSDSNSNTWTGLTEFVTPSFAAGKLYYCINPITGSGHTFTVTDGGIGGSGPGIGILAFSGDGAFDTQNGSNSDATEPGNTIQAGSLTPSKNNSLIIAGTGCFQFSLLIDSGFTAFTQDFVSAQGEAIGIAYLIQGVAAAVNPTWSWTDPMFTGAAVAVIASFKPAV